MQSTKRKVLREMGLTWVYSGRWSGTPQELMELIEMPELAWYEWKACMTQRAIADGLLSPGESAQSAVAA